MTHDASVETRLNAQPQGVAFEQGKKSWEYLRDSDDNHGRQGSECGTPSECWASFWVDVVWDGRPPTISEIQAELSDYHAMMRDVALVYDTVSGGRISYPNTRSFEVIREYEQRQDEMYSATHRKIARALMSREVREKFLPGMHPDDVEMLADAIMSEWDTDD